MKGKTVKKLHLLAAVAGILCSSYAAAACDPSTAGGTGGPLKATPHPSGAVVYAWRCPPDQAVAFIVARPEWKPQIPAEPRAQLAELRRLRVMLDYAADPGFLAEFVASIDPPPVK